jgi:hypothetical protein
LFLNYLTAVNSLGWCFHSAGYKFATLLNKNAPHFMRSICCPMRIGSACASPIRKSFLLLPDQDWLGLRLADP